MKMWLLNRAKLASLVDPDNEIVTVPMGRLRFIITQL